MAFSSTPTVSVASSPAVSVCVVTYNQERYLKACLESIVNQQTDFEFEVVIGVDPSTDGTPRIVEEFSRRYPRTVRATYHRVRQGAVRNSYITYSQARGEYIAHMDGDDLMLPGKLQKQYEFISARPDCAFVAHKMFVVAEDGRRRLGVTPISDRPERSDLASLVRTYLFFAHSSKMFRRSAHERFYGNGVYRDDAIDFVWHVEHASTGWIGFINEVLGEYRSGSLGSSSGAKDFDRVHWLLQTTLHGYDRALELGVEPRIVRRGRARYLFGAAIHCMQLGDRLGMQKYLAECVSFLQLHRTPRGVLERLIAARSLTWFVLRLALLSRVAKHRLRAKLAIITLKRSRARASVKSTYDKHA